MNQNPRSSVILHNNSVVELHWSVHLAKKEPQKAIVVYLCAALGGLFAVAILGNMWMFPVGTLVILLSLGDFLLPVRFAITKTGVHRRCGLSASSIEWEKVKRMVETEDGVKLSPFAEAGKRTGPFRGVFLRAEGNLQEILAAVEYWRNEHASDVGKPADGRREREADPARS